MSSIGFKTMALGFKVRDALKPRKEIIDEVGLKSGFHVLDFGCGPGGYVFVTSEAIGVTGKLYALDINPAAIEMVNKIIAKHNLKNVETILSSGGGILLGNAELDAVLLYDVFHGLKDQNGVLKEIHRVLKPTGMLSFSDHHFGEDEILSKVTDSGLFCLKVKGKYTYTFAIC